MLLKFTERRLEELFKMSPPEALDAAVEDLVTFIDETQDFTLFWYQETKNLKSEELSRLLKYENEVVDLLRRLLQWGVDTGYFRIKDVNLVAQDIMVLCDMWAFRRWSLRKDYSVKQFKQDQKKIISRIAMFDGA
jgi:hypothetical protein